MRIESPLGSFIDTLRNIRDIALMYQDRFSKSEASTRSALIDPILRALGWDSANPNMIEFERTFPQSRVDYALYNHEKNVQIIIEAKALGGNLEAKGILLNLIMYAIASGVQDIFLTDGVIWEHYTNFSPGNVGSTKTLDITKDNLLECASYLIQKLDAAMFWPVDVTMEAEVTGNLSKQILDLRNEISNLKNDLATLQYAKESSRVTPKDISISPKDVSNYIGLTDLPSNLTGKKPPVSIRLPDGTIKDISTWRDILLESCHYVLDNNPSIQIPLSDAAGKKVKLFDTKPPGKGIAHHKYEYHGKPLYIYANYDSNHCVINARHILKYLDPSTFKSNIAVKFSEDIATI